MLSTHRPAGRHHDDGTIGPTPRRIRLIVVDDHPAVRFGLAQLLEGQRDFEVEAACINAEAAVAHATAPARSRGASVV